jgi:hypothetical protein
MGFHGTAALTHTVYFGLLHVKTQIHGCQIDDGCDGKDSLSAYAGDDDISLHIFLAVSCQLSAVSLLGQCFLFQRFASEFLVFSNQLF